MIDLKTLLMINGAMLFLVLFIFKIMPIIAKKIQMQFEQFSLAILLSFNIVFTAISPMLLFLFLTIPSSTSAIKEIINENRQFSEYQIKKLNDETSRQIDDLTGTTKKYILSISAIDSKKKRLFINQALTEIELNTHIIKEFNKRTMSFLGGSSADMKFSTLSLDALIINQIIEDKDLLTNTLRLRNLYSMFNDIIDAVRYVGGVESRNNVEYFYSMINNSKRLDFITEMKNRLTEYKQKV